MAGQQSRATHHRIVIIGGGTAGVTTAARLRRAGERDVTLVEPSQVHYYQPLWTLVGAGVVRLEKTRRPQSKVMPRGVRWMRDHAESVDPEAKMVTLRSGATLSYDALVIATGMVADWDAIPGLNGRVGRDGIVSNYAAEFAPRTWEAVRGLRRGTAVFTMPPGPVKCPGAAQKIAYMAADHWRREGVLDDIRVILAIPTPALFGIESFSRTLEGVAARYGIEVRTTTELVGVDADRRVATLLENAGGDKEEVAYDMLHVVPPHRAPEWVARSPLANPEDSGGYVTVDRHTLQHPVFPDVFALGDVADVPTARTGAAVRKQAPVVSRNLRATLASQPHEGAYHGYTSCPLTTARGRLVLAEFDYDVNHTPSIPLLDTTRERRSMWLLKRHGLPALYWHLMLRGRA